MSVVRAAMDPASITPDTVRRHAFLLCLDVPAGTEFGLDLKMWTVGEKFKGMKLIPPGPHLLYWRYAVHTFLTS